MDKQAKAKRKRNEEAKEKAIIQRRLKREQAVNKMMLKKMGRNP